jgi:hypothetical protein
VVLDEEESGKNIETCDSYGVNAILISLSDLILLAASELQTSLKRSSGHAVLMPVKWLCEWKSTKFG